MKVVAIIPAAGLGTRMGKPSAEATGTSRKQFMLLAGAPILLHTIRKFAANPKISQIIVAIRQEDRAEFEANLTEKLADPAFIEDIEPLLRAGTSHDALAAGALVRQQLIAKLGTQPGRER